MFAAVYPLATGLSYRMQGVAGEWAIWQRHLVVLPIVVRAMIFGIVPGMHRLLARGSERAA